MKENTLSLRIAVSLFACFLLLFLVAVATLPFGNSIMHTLFPRSVTLAAAPVIENISTNAADYPDSQIPRYEKLEISFTVDTQADNMYIPHDPSPPAGVNTNGISVDVLFSPDNWLTTYRQPAFYYQEFLDERRGGQSQLEWFYPTDTFVWKARFAPDQEGLWRFKITATDSEGTTESNEHTFTVTGSDKNGFVQVSEDDPRYFEFEDGTYFPALGYNMNYDQISWTHPVASNEANFQTMSENGIQLIRMWLSQWAIWGSAWNPWYDINNHQGYIPAARLVLDGVNTDAGSEAAMIVNNVVIPCMFTGYQKAPAAVKQHTNYRVQVRYKMQNLTGPRVSEQPYGLVAKVGGWLTDCQDSGTGTVITEYASANTDTDPEPWQIIEGTWNSGNNHFLPFFYLTTENVNTGRASIDYVWMQEDLGGGNYGPNIMSKPWMSHHLYMEQRNSYAFDKVLQLAEQHDVYLRPVMLERQDYITERIFPDGSVDDNSPSQNNFYGPNSRSVTKVRWLQQAWWRYAQARWGYSTNIHSWELLNEGDPANTRHFIQADEFGKYMKCRVFGVSVGSQDGDLCTHNHPNAHLVSTSNWHSFPTGLWASDTYPNVDFADVHRYIPQNDSDYNDSVTATINASLQYHTAMVNAGKVKPIIRGETGFTTTESEPGSPELLDDTDGVWLHNFLWAGINHGGLIESYWYANYHIYNAQAGFDNRSVFRPFRNFIEDEPLNKGGYEAIQADTSNDELRVVGQYSTPHDQGHLWIQNKAYTWRNVVDENSITPQSGTVTISGVTPDTIYTIETWNTYETDKSEQIVNTATQESNSSGEITLALSSLGTDVAYKFHTQEPSPTPTPGPTPTSTPVPTPTNTPAPTPTPTTGPTPTAGPTPTSSPTPTNTPAPTSTPVPTPPPPPTLNATFPHVYADSVTFSGSKQANTAIRINGVTVVAQNSSTSWSASRPLSLGTNTFSVRARRGSLDSSPINRTIIRQGLADINADGIVNIFDLGIFAGNYGRENIQISDPRNVRMSDMNQDGRVNIFDLGIFAGRYGSTYSY